jgi:hypothetical protein
MNVDFQMQFEVERVVPNALSVLSFTSQHVEANALHLGGLR